MIVDLLVAVGCRLRLPRPIPKASIVIDKIEKNVDFLEKCRKFVEFDHTFYVG